jgi:LysM repeat protein
MTRDRLVLLVGVIGATIGLGLGYINTSARSLHSSKAYDLVDEVNRRRVAAGLYPYKVNDALMSSAQAHSEYQAAIGNITHSGAGGTSPVDRAIAAGYGGGAQVFVTENIYGGRNTSSADAVSWWIADGGWHYEGVLSSRYQDVGAGVASGGDYTYYTLDVGITVGEAPTPGQSQPAPPPGSTQTVNTPAPPKVKPVKKATALPDGSVIHVVEQGQTLWTIAAIYGVPLKEILKLNKLTENSFVFPGDKVIVQSFTPAPTVSETPSPTETVINPTPTSTRFARTITIASPLLTTASSINSTNKPTKLDPKRGIAALIIAILAIVAIITLSVSKKSGDST